MSDIVFYTNPQSRGQIVRWMLEELGQPYETVVLDFGTTMKSKDYLAINPMGKVPAIRHRGRVITEGAAICAYLADAYPEAGLAPPIADRHAYYRWMFFGAGPVESAMLDRYRKLEPEGDQKVMAGYGDFASVEQALELAVSDGPFICGQQFTAADVYFGSSIDWQVQFNMLSPSPAVAAYLDRIRSRPAYSQAKEIDAALAEKSSASE